MKNKKLKILSLSVLLSSLLISGCGCGKEVSISFIGDNSTIIKKIKQGSSLSKDQIPQPPKQKGKYCLWDINEFNNVNSDINVNYTCYDSVTKLETNLDKNITVLVSSNEAKLDYIFRNLVVTATLDDNTTKTLYKEDLKIDDSKYDFNKSGVQTVTITYNNKSLDIDINVVKVDKYVTVSLESTTAYINEGLPKIYANTTVPGVIKFDDNQELFLGTYEYSWTFLPEDLNKYEIIKGVNEVTMLNASSISTNKDSFVFEFEYNTSKQDIIDNIKDGLVVKGKFGKEERIIDEKYYTIESNYLANQPGKNIEFVVKYGTGKYQITKVFKVDVKKRSDYEVEFEPMDAIIIDDDTTMDDLLKVVTQHYHATLKGNLIFASDQTVKEGNGTYKYIFTPDNQYYETKVGFVKIKTKKWLGIQTQEGYMPNYDYGSKTKEEVIEDLLVNFKGELVYSDNSVEPVDNSKISIKILNYDSKVPGTYKYVVIYNNAGEEFEFEFKVNKLNLKENEDFIVKVDKKQSDPLKQPDISLESKDPNFDANNFDLVFIEVNKLDNTNTYVYTYKIVPNEELIDMYNVLTIQVKIDY